MKGKVLIIDDEYSFAEFARMLLSAHGYDAVVCLESEQGLQKAIAEKPALVLVDMNMPRARGTDVIRQLKAEPATKDIPCVLCSMTSSPSEVKEALDSGAVEFLPKPLDPARFGACLERLMAGKR